VKRRQGSRRALAALAALALAASLGTVACAEKEAPKPARASFGVFFGGQVQEREEVPLILDRARQSIGVRVEFVEPPTVPQEVSWELEKPGGGKDAGPSIVDYGAARTRPGEPVLDIPLAFRPGDRLGNWRVRVTLGRQKLLDRAFRVVAPSPPRPAEE
jgi:hypothetical protein